MGLADARKQSIAYLVARLLIFANTWVLLQFNFRINRINSRINSRINRVGSIAGINKGSIGSVSIDPHRKSIDTDPIDTIDTRQAGNRHGKAFVRLVNGDAVAHMVSLKM